MTSVLLNNFILLFALTHKVAKKSRKFNATRYFVATPALRGDAKFSAF
jgi:hypothetical protein